MISFAIVSHYTTMHSIKGMNRMDEVIKPVKARIKIKGTCAQMGRELILGSKGGWKRRCIS